VFSSPVCPAVCLALLSAFFRCSGGPGSSARRAQGNHQIPLPLTAPSHETPGIEQSHRRTCDLKPVLLDIDQLFDSAAVLFQPSSSVRKMAHTNPTVHVREATVLEVLKSPAWCSDIEFCNDSEDLYRCMWQCEKTLSTLFLRHHKSWPVTRNIVTQQHPRTSPCHFFGSAVEANVRSPKETKRSQSQESSKTRSIECLVPIRFSLQDLLRRLAHLTLLFMIHACKIPQPVKPIVVLIRLLVFATSRSISHHT
jgi:hypothetical protein